MATPKDDVTVIAPDSPEGRRCWNALNVRSPSAWRI